MRLFSIYYDVVINKINFVDYSIFYYKFYIEKLNYIEVKKMFDMREKIIQIQWD